MFMYIHDAILLSKWIEFNERAGTPRGGRHCPAISFPSMDITVDGWISASYDYHDESIINVDHAGEWIDFKISEIKAMVEQHELRMDIAEKAMTEKVKSRSL